MTTAFDTIKSAILGNPVNPNKLPSRTGVVKAFAEMQVQLEAAQAGAYVRDTKVNLDLLLAAPVSAMAWVVGDSTTANNGIYQNTGTAIAAVWTRRTDIPEYVITAINVGAGTVDAIQVTTDLPVPSADGRAMVIVPVLGANTVSPPTVSINGGAALPIVTNTGNNVAVGGITDGMYLAGFIAGGKYRLVSDQASAAVLAAAEDAQLAAEIAQAAAETAANEAEAAQAAAEAAAAGVDLPPVAANRMLVDNAAGTARESKTFSEVRGLLDAVATQEFGSDSVARSLTQRFGDVVDLDDFGLDGSGNTSTVAANDAAIAKLVTYMNGAGVGKTYRSRKGRIYCFSAAFTFPAVRTRLEGATFRYIGNTVSSGDLIHFNGTDFDNLDCHLPTGSFRVRPIKVTGCRGDHIDLKSDDQLNNYNASNIDYAIRLYGRASLGQENRIGEIYIDGFNKTILVLGDTFAKADPQRGGYIGYVSMKNYEKGLTVRNVDGMSFRGGFIRSRSSSAGIGDPGNNGVLLASAKNCFFRDFLIEDSAEHGWRCAGDDLGNEVESYNNHISDVVIKRAQQCGFKIWVGNLTYKTRGGTVQNITVEDAAATNPSTTGFNYSAFLLQNFDHMNFSNLQALGVDQAYSGREAFFIGAGGRSTLSGLRSFNGGRVNGIRFSEFNNGESDTVNNLAAQNQVKVEGFYSEGHTGAGVFIDHPTQAVRDVVMTSGNIIGGTHGFDGSAAAARFAQPCVFQARVRGNSGSFSNLPASANISTINLGTSVA